MILSSGIAALLALSSLAKVSADAGALGCESAFARCNVDGEVCLANGNIKAWGWSTPLTGISKSVNCELWIRAPKCDTTSEGSKMIGSVTVNPATSAISVHVSDPDYVLSGMQAYSGAEITPSHEKEITSTRFNPAVSEAVIASALTGSHDFLIAHVHVCPKDLVMPEEEADSTHRSLTFGLFNWWHPAPTPPSHPAPAPSPTYKFDWWCWICGTCGGPSPSPPPPALRPTCAPTVKPTAKPVSPPTKPPTCPPTVKPTKPPTCAPTAKPTAKPTKKPTAKPTRKPTVKPTRKPTVKPTRKPTVKPTRKPTVKPTRKPTVKPTRKPVAKPSSKPVGDW